MELGEAFPAVQSAEMAVQLSPSWATGRQTLGRSQLGIGEVHMVSNSNNSKIEHEAAANTPLPSPYFLFQALRSFEKAVHLDPSNVELWEEDMQWARELVREKDKMAAGGIVRGEEEKGGEEVQV